MDDTIWIADSYDQMSSILNIAQIFYELNSMKVNFDKSYLITDNSNTKSIIFRNSYDNSTFECQTSHSGIRLDTLVYRFLLNIIRCLSNTKSLQKLPYLEINLDSNL